MSDLKECQKYFENLENRARYKLIKRYNKPLSYHDIKIINAVHITGYSINIFSPSKFFS